MARRHDSCNPFESSYITSGSSSSDSSERFGRSCSEPGHPIIISTLPSEAIPLTYTAGQSCNPHPPTCGSCGPHPGPPPRPPPCEQGFAFRALITPLTSIATPYSTHAPLVEFMIRRKNQIVTLQWEPFEGSLGQTGVAALVVNNSISSLPPYPIKLPIVLSYNSVYVASHTLLDPGAATPLMFYLNQTESGSGVSMGDTVKMPGGSMTWITNY